MGVGVNIRRHLVLFVINYVYVKGYDECFVEASTVLLKTKESRKLYVYLWYDDESRRKGIVGGGFEWFCICVLQRWPFPGNSSIFQAVLAWKPDGVSTTL